MGVGAFNETPLRRGRVISPILIRSGTISMGIFLAIVLIEIGGRLLGIFIEPPPWWLDLQTRVQDLYRPGERYVMKSDEWDSVRQANSRGLVDVEHDLAARPNTYRILFLGDSFVSGERIGLEQTFVRRVNRQSTVLEALGREKLSLETINAGIGGTGTGEQYIYYQAEGRNYCPDLVILVFYLGNDVINNAFELNGSNPNNVKRPYFEVGTRGELIERCRPRHTLERALYLRTFFWRIVGGELRQLSRLWSERGSGPQRPTEAQVTVWDRMYMEGMYPELENAYKITAAILDHLKKSTRSDGAEFLVALMPTKEQAEDREGERKKGFTPLLPNQRMAEILNGLRIPFLDLTPLLREEWEKTGRSPYFETDMHLNACGNQRVADEIARWLSMIQPWNKRNRFN